MLSIPEESLSTHASILAAVERLRAGEPVAMPTETVYGLAGDASNAQAVAKIFALKGRHASNPLIVHVTSKDMANHYVIWNDLAERLASEFWPGPLTMVLPLRADAGIAPAVIAGGDTLAIRCPAHPVARALIEGYGKGLAAPSANLSGRVSPTSAAHVRTEFPDDALMILDGGACEVGLESTVVDCTGNAPVVLRPGSIAIRSSCDQATRDAQDLDSAPSRGDSQNDYILRSPGLLSSHYAPATPVRLNADRVEPDEALLAFGEDPLRGAKVTLNLSEHGEVAEAAANLYAMLRELDVAQCRAIAVMPIPKEGVGLAINDRLMRAAVKA